jgi:hypothetical protein
MKEKKLIPKSNSATMHVKQLPGSWRHIRMAELAKQQINHHYISVESNKYKINPCNSERFTLLYNMHEQSSKKSIPSISQFVMKKNLPHGRSSKKNTKEYHTLNYFPSAALFRSRSLLINIKYKMYYHTQIATTESHWNL